MTVLRTFDPALLIRLTMQESNRWPLRLKAEPSETEAKEAKARQTPLSDAPGIRSRPR